MIYLIGGSPRSGKTILSKKLSERLNIQYISTDVLRLFMVASLQADDKYRYFPFEKIFDSAASVDTFYDKTSGSEMLSADIEEAKNLMPGILAVIEHYKKSGIDYVIEGVHFLPELIHHLKDEEGIKMIILYKNNRNKIYLGLKENQGNGDWIADNIHDEEILLKAAESLSEYGNYFEKKSLQYHLKTINTTDNFLDKIETALSQLG